MAGPPRYEEQGASTFFIDFAIFSLSPPLTEGRQCIATFAIMN